eukprot:g1262.t1
MQAARSSFASFDTHARNRQGINGALTPARPHRSSHRQKSANDLDPASTSSTPNPANPSAQIPSRLRKRQEKLIGGEGISLQETEARIDELERGEFDLKLKLFYMEEQLASATGGEDGLLSLHKEVIDAKLHRAQAEQKARLAEAALSEVEAECKELEKQVLECEEQRTKDRENWATLEGENEARLKKHTHLLEDALRTERAENARLRLAVDSRRGSWDGGAQQSRVAPRRRSTGEDDRGQPPDPWRGSGGGGGGFLREQRDQQQQLTAKLRSQDSSLRSLRADVTTLRRRLRTQAETLAQQKEENATVRRAAEEVACVEAEEIARLAVDLERAVRAAKAEAEKRRDVEERLSTAEARLAGRKTGRREPRSLQSKRSRSPIRPALVGGGTGGRTPGRGEREAEGGGERAKSADMHAGEVVHAPPGENSGEECSSLPPPPRGAFSSTIASRGRSVHDRPATGSNGLSGKGRTSVSPGRSRGAEAKGHRRPWGSSPPPSPRRKVDGPGASAAATVTRRRPLVDAGASPAERRKHHRQRHSEEQLPAERASTGRGGDQGWRGIKPGNPPARQTAKDPPAREGRQPSTGRPEAESLSLPSSSERRGGTKHAPVAETGRNKMAEAWRERPPSSRYEAQAKPGAGTATATAAALGGVDLSAKIAQELRAAVATTPASAVSPGYFSDDGGSGHTSPAVGGVGGGGGGGCRVGDDEQRKNMNILACLEGGDLLTSIWQGSGDHHAVDGDKRKPITAMRSREVAELESDVQHIFQFFAAKDGRRRSGIGAADPRENGEAVDTV